MSLIQAGGRETQGIPPGRVMTIVCTGSARLWGYPESAGAGQAVLLATLGAGTTTYGPFLTLQSYEIECLSGTADASIGPADLGAQENPIGRLFEGGSVYQPERPSGFDGGRLLASVVPYRAGNRWDCNVTPESLIDTEAWTRTYFVDAVGGNNANTGLSWAQRVQSIGAAMRLASASGQASRILVDASAALPYYRQISCGDDGAQRVSAVPILLEAVNGRAVSGTFDNLTWTKTAGQTYVYQATRSNAVRVANWTAFNAVGLPLEYTWVASIAACDAAEGSWFTDGTTVYVHPHGDLRPTINNARVILRSTLGLEWASNQNLFVRNFDFIGGQGGAFRCQGGSTNLIVLDNCTMRHAATSNTENGGVLYVDAAQIQGCGLFAAFDCKADYGAKDGFNVHAEGGVIPAALLVRCSAMFNGRGASTSNNGFTTHDGIKSISIGGDYRFNRGIGSGHVNANTQAWCCGDVAGASFGDVPNGGTFSQAGFAGWTSMAGLWLDSCQDVGAELGVWSDISPAVVRLRNHRGSGQRVGVTTY